MNDAPVLVAPDKFKGTFSAREVAGAIADGLRQAGREAEELPVADGGEGTAEALGATPAAAEASDPLGRRVEAFFAWLDEGETAIVEAAAASGLWRLSPAELDPLTATSAGTGELVTAAIDAGARHVIVACGGTATVDGGRGMLAALDKVPRGIRFTAVCDVRTPWERAATDFGPQKGADKDAVKRLSAKLARRARAMKTDPRGVPMTGCGGGISGALWSELGAELVAGPSYVLDAIGFDDHMRGAPFVVTGEGKLDESTLAGKAVAEVATRCRQAGVWCHAVVGEDRLDMFGRRVLDLASVREARDPRALRRAGQELA
ncbi:MAG: glycerate kinase [Thermoleophilaceae bacterium]